jgi:hypothetical protein
MACLCDVERQCEYWTAGLLWVELAQVVKYCVRVCRSVTWLVRFASFVEQKHKCPVQKLQPDTLCTPHTHTNTHTHTKRTLVPGALCAEFHHLALTVPPWERETVSRICQYWNSKHFMLHSSTNCEFKFPTAADNNMAGAQTTGVGSALHALNVCDTVASDMGVLPFVIRLMFVRNFQKRSPQSSFYAYQHTWYQLPREWLDTEIKKKNSIYWYIM